MSATHAVNLHARRFPVRIAVLVVGSLLALGIFAWLIAPSSESAPIDVAAPSFSLPSVNGNSTVDFSSRAGKPAVINFFASWCIPCRRELPRLAEASKANKSVAFFGIDHQDSRTQAQDLLTASNVTYPSGYDPKGSVAASYGVTTGLPTTVFIDRTGHVVHTAYGEISQQELQTQMQRLVGEQ